MPSAGVDLTDPGRRDNLARGLTRSHTTARRHMTRLRLLELDHGSIDAMLAVERAVFIPPMQASGDTMRRRLDMGHVMLGLAREDDGALAGMGCFSYAWLPPAGIDALAGFPRDEHEFCSWPVPKEFNAAFAYNLAILPRYRSYPVLRMLFHAGLERMQRDGVRYGFNCVRLASYNGSEAHGFATESIPQRPRLKAAIDRYLAHGVFPSREVLDLEPLARLERRLCDCVYRWILPDFAPWDAASGGHRLLGIVDVPAWQGGRSARAPGAALDVAPAGP